jgi:hypothetical protein
MGEWMYGSTFSWPRHYLQVSGQLHGPAVLPPRKDPPPQYPSDRLGGHQSPSGRQWRRENSWSYQNSNSDPSVVLPIACRYTDYAIPAIQISLKTEILIFLKRKNFVLGEGETRHFPHIPKWAKWPRREADHSPPSSVELRKCGSRLPVHAHP